MKSIFLLPAALPAVLALSAHAQPPVSAPAADPAAIAYSAAAPAYHSAFDGYRGSGEIRAPVHPSLNAWRAANDAVNKPDMHAGHMQMPTSDTKSPVDASHAGHANHTASHHTGHQADQVDHRADRPIGHDMHQHHHGDGK